MVSVVCAMVEVVHQRLLWSFYEPYRRHLVVSGSIYCAFKTDYHRLGMKYEITAEFTPLKKKLQKMNDLVD